MYEYPAYFYYLNPYIYNMDLISKLFLNSVAIIIMSLMAILDYSRTDKRTNTFKYLRKYLYILIFGYLLVSFYVTIKDHYRENKLRNENIAINKSLDSLSRLTYNISLVNSEKIDTSITQLNEIINKSINTLKRIQSTSIRLDSIVYGNKILKYPLPHELILNLHVTFKFNELISNSLHSLVEFNKFESIDLNANEEIIINFNELNKIIKLPEFHKNIDIIFARNYNENSGIHSIFALDNYTRVTNQMPWINAFENNNNGTIVMTYSPMEKSFNLIYDNIILKKEILPTQGLLTNIVAKSILELKNSTALINLWLPEEVVNSKIKYFDLSSDELSLIKFNLNKSSNEIFHYFVVDKL